ncbi:hypothetical protein Rhal01_02856 [Rubritalea halochordaticola]|uniref:Glycosyltransferase family 2 protein n=2 Tax=Rubritalea halochordaticola TaxID=714537 RepID=A0ABP9V6E6_9BACT
MRIAICCLARDCLGGLQRNEAFIERLRGVAQESHVIIVENDSRDGTKEYLAEYQKRADNVFIDSFDTGKQTLLKVAEDGVNPSYSRYRIEKMASYRNRYLDLLHNKIGLGNLDWVMMLDPDVREIDFDGVRHSFGMSKNWDVIHANGRRRSGLCKELYYDTYAFAEFMDDVAQHEETIFMNQYRLSAIQKEMPLFPVRSGFNALAIYRAEALTGLRYECVDNQKGDGRVEVLCEHVSFHEAIMNNGFSRQFLNPRMTLYYNTRWEALQLLFRMTARRLLRR